MPSIDVLTHGRDMTARFNHTIIAAKSRPESADFYRQILEGAWRVG